ncbi:caspase family protein [Kitasatospora sp. GP82]|uniref:caspase, EACC1-associated type n=1 Tax=Kitasatospora sp. GP82 TaxID=3035089 RepID=UPI0024740B50|nr:caspase family protein [Kitasatospora sp. GP82]MDH6126045.1 hypothetical protein [Kitasatospora sp. GP82]
MPPASWPALLPDRQTSWAVLVAVSGYTDPELPDLPQAVDSVERLADALTGPDGVLDRARVIRLVDPQTPGEVLAALAEAAASARGLLLFHYVGHGVTGADERLHLALPGTDGDPDHAARTSLAAEAVFATMHGAAAWSVALLDCCFSGLALDAPSAADVHLLTAADRDRKALIPQGSQVTGFTAELLRVLDEGVPDGPEHLDLSLLHRRLAVALGTVPAGAPVGSRAPNPCQRSVGSSGELALARNPAHGTALSRDGLRARARFAYRVAEVRHLKQPWRQAQAAALLAGIAADATASLGPDDPDTLRLRHAHASLTGTAHGRQAALDLFTPLLAHMAAVLAPDDAILVAARDSAAHWSART